MLSLAKAFTVAIVTRSLFFGTSTANGLHPGHDRMLSSDDEGFSNRLGELEHTTFEQEDDTLSLRKLLQASGTNEAWTTT